MRKRINGSMTVEAAMLYPYFLLITCLLIRLTVARYGMVRKQAATLYDEVFKERKLQTSEVLRLTDTAFDFLEGYREGE